VRLSVGLECGEDLIADVITALEASTCTRSLRIATAS